MSSASSPREKSLIFEGSSIFFFQFPSWTPYTEHAHTHTHTHEQIKYFYLQEVIWSIARKTKRSIWRECWEKRTPAKKEKRHSQMFGLMRPFSVSILRRYKINDDYSYGLWNRLLFCLSDTKTKLKLNDRQRERERFDLPRGFLVLSPLHNVTVAVRGAVGIDGDEQTALSDACLHLLHLNSSFFFTLVKPTQTRWNHRSQASQQTPGERRSMHLPFTGESKKWLTFNGRATRFQTEASIDRALVFAAAGHRRFLRRLLIVVVGDQQRIVVVIEIGLRRGFDRRLLQIDHRGNIDHRRR